MNTKSFLIDLSQTEKLRREGSEFCDSDQLAQIKHQAQSGTKFPFSKGIEWVRIAPDRVVVATANRAWIHQSSPVGSSDLFAQPMTTKGTLATTRNLLDGAIAAAKIAMPPSKPPAMTPIRLLWRLAGAYHLNHSTTRHMEEASRRFAAAGRKRLAEWAAQKAIEEDGHDELALLDIQSLGYDAQSVVKALVPPAAIDVLDYFTKSIQAPDPIGCLGYAYTVERLAICIGEHYIQAVEAMLPPGTNATRCLRIHSSIGYEVEHVQETVEMVADLTPQERTSVTVSCYETALRFFTPPKEGYLSDEEIQKVLETMDLSTFS
jgi:hypothetical protein